MSTAILTPLPDRSCLFEVDGIVRRLGSYAAAEAEARARELLFQVDRFPAPSVVLAESPHRA